MYRYFQSIKPSKEELRRQKIRDNIEREQKRESKRNAIIINEWRKREQERLREQVTKIYQNLRYYIRLDGTVYNWGDSFANVLIRRRREQSMMENEKKVKAELEN